jgi:hypothetical protein
LSLGGRDDRMTVSRQIRIMQTLCMIIRSVLNLIGMQSKLRLAQMPNAALGFHSFVAATPILRLLEPFDPDDVRRQRIRLFIKHSEADPFWRAAFWGCSPHFTRCLGLRARQCTQGLDDGRGSSTKAPPSLRGPGSGADAVRPVEFGH